MEAAVRDYRRVARIAAPATIDGGDVLHIGDRLFDGVTSRTNHAAIAQLREILPPRYTVVPVPLRDALHLKTAVTYAGRNTLVINREWLEPFEGFEIIEVAASEPFAGNVLAIGDTVVGAAAHARTNAKLRARGFDVREIAADELAKAEGGLTCCSVIFEA